MLILIKYGPENPAERWKLEAARPTDQVVLIQNGIFWAITEPSMLDGKKVSLLQPDLEARGYKAEESKWPVIDYVSLISLIEENPQSMS